MALDLPIPGEFNWADKLNDALDSLEVDKLDADVAGATYESLVVAVGPGIDPTGVTDSTAAIQALIDGLPVGGGTILLPAGTYLSTGLRYAHGLTLRGANMHLTTLKKAPAGNSNLVAGGVLGSIGSTEDPVRDFTLADLTLDGQQAVDTSGVGTSLLHAYACKRLRVRRVRFKNSTGYGIGLQGSPSNPSPSKRGPIEDVTLEGCEFIDNGYLNGTPNTSDGLDIKSSDRVTVIDCLATGSTDKGFNIRGKFVTMIGCRAENNVNGYDLNAHNDPTVMGLVDSYFSLFGCAAEQNTSTGINITSTENSTTHASLVGCDSIKNNGNGASIGGAGQKVHCSILGGQYSQNLTRGIALTEVTEARVAQVTLRNNSGDGARLTGQAGAVFTACSVQNNGAFGIRAVTSSSIHITDTVFAGNVSGPLTAETQAFRLRGNRGLPVSFNAAAAPSLGTFDRPLIGVAGATTITSIGATFAGDVITLRFTGTAQVTDGGNLRLAGNFTGGADRTLTLVCDGTDWIETARSVN